MADLRVTLLSLALEARVCVPAVKVHFFLVFLDLQTELPACLSNIRAGAVLARDTIDQFGLLFILNLVLWMNHKVPLVTHKSAITDHAVEENHVIDWHKAKVVDRGTATDQMDKRGTLDRKTQKCMNRDAGSYQLSHTWDQVISRSRAPSSCKQSRCPTDIETLSLGNIFSVV